MRSSYRQDQCLQGASTLKLKRGNSLGCTAAEFPSNIDGWNATKGNKDEESKRGEESAQGPGRVVGPTALERRGKATRETEESWTRRRENWLRRRTVESYGSEG